ncbi:MAG: TonB-dependent receptor, partial [Myxococcota bacterium]
LFLFTSVWRRQEVDLNGDDFSELTRLRQVSGGANAFWSPTDEIDLELNVHAVQEYRRGGDRLDQPPHEADIAEELQTERLQGQLRFKHNVSPQLDYQLAYAMAFTDRRSYYGGGGFSADPQPPPAGAAESRYEEFLDEWEAQQVALGGYGRTLNPVHTGDAHVNTYLGVERPMVLTVGGQFQVDDIEDRYLGYEREIDVVYTVVGGYLQHNWLFADWGESVVGLRVDQHSEVDEPIFSPRLALMFTPLSIVRLRTSLSAGFRAPQAFDEDLHIEVVGGAARVITNAPGLEVERSWSAAQQVALELDLADGWNVRSGVNGFATLLQDAFVTNERDDPTTPEEEVVRENRGTTTVWGAEIEAGASYRNIWSMRLGWTMEYAANDEPDEDFGQRRLFRTPLHYGYLETQALLADRLQFQAGLDITGPMLVPHYDAEGDPFDEVERSPWFFDLSFNLSTQFVGDDGVFLEPFVGM